MPQLSLDSLEKTIGGKVLCADALFGRTGRSKEKGEEGLRIKKEITAELTTAL